MSAVSQPNVHASSLRRDLGLVGWQIRYEQRAYWRNRSRGIFTFAFPIMFLVIFASLDKGQHISTRGGIPYDDFFVPGILAYGVIATTFVNLAISTAILRDDGVLKRMQGTPLSRWGTPRRAFCSRMLRSASSPERSGGRWPGSASSTRESRRPRSPRANPRSPRASRK
jgi:hypothetical protein